MSRSIFVVGAVALLIFAARQVYAYNGVGFSGSNCQATTTSSANVVWHGSGHSASTAGDGQLTCPVSFPLNTSQALVYDSIQAEIYDPNSSGDMVCTPVNQDPGVAVSYAQSMHTCNTWGGCTTNSSPGDTGWMTLFWNNSRSYIGHSSGSHNFVYDYSAFALLCTFPLGQYSGIWNYRVYLN